MGWFIFGIVLFAAALAWWILSRSIRDIPRIARNGGSTAAAILGVLMIILSMVTIVNTKNVGVVTVFGRPTGALNNGLHFTSPWENVTEIDGAIQTDSHVDIDGTDVHEATVVRIGNMSTARVDNTIRWRIIPDQADELYRDYRGFGNIRDSLVTRQLNEVLNVVFSDYDPLSVNANGQVGVVDYVDFSDRVETILRDRIGTQIEILDITIPLVRFDDSTQSRINAYQEEIGNTRIATQKKETAKEQAEANEALAASVSNDPNVLVAQCLNTFEVMVEKGQTVPAGFSCWPGSGSAIVVPSATQPKP